MPENALALVLAAAPPTILALATLIVGIINSIKANKIHVLVNSNMQDMKTELATANASIAALQGVIIHQNNISGKAS